MRTSLLLSVAAVSFVLAGCPSPAALCKSGVDQICERNHECQPDQVKSSPQFQAAFGTSAEDCKTKLYANPAAPLGMQAASCDSITDDAALCANLGAPNATRFNLGEASACRDARAALSCEDYLAQQANPTLAPASCGRRCEP